MGKTFKDGRIDRYREEERTIKRTQKHQDYGTSRKQKKEIKRISDRLSD